MRKSLRLLVALLALTFFAGVAAADPPTGGTEQHRSAVTKKRHKTAHKKTAHKKTATRGGTHKKTRAR